MSTMFVGWANSCSMVRPSGSVFPLAARSPKGLLAFAGIHLAKVVFGFLDWPGGRKGLGILVFGFGF